MVKKARKRALQELKKTKYVQTDDAKTVNNDDDVNNDDLVTVGYNSDTEINLADKATPLSSTAQQQAKMTIKRYKTLTRKVGKINQEAKNKRKDDDIKLVKQVPLHPGERLARETRKQKDGDVIFVKQVPLHSRQRLARETKKI